MKYSVIVPTYDNLPMLVRLMESMQMQTDMEIIIVNQGKDLSYATQSVIINTHENLGWVKAINLGLSKATGDYIVFLNDDTVVYPGWLEAMSSAMEQAELEFKAPIGICGPLTNRTMSEQCIDVGDDIRKITPEFLDKIAKDNPPFVDTEFVTGFCMMVKRELFDKIGGLDERFGLGGYDDNDYCIRAKEAGYGIIVAPQVFVWHEAGITIDRVAPESHRGTENKPIFFDKWHDKFFGKKADSCLDLSLCMIVKDQGKKLDDFMFKVWPIVREIVIIDTGSVDNTMERAGKYADHVVKLETTDLCVARMEADKYATKDWILVLDPDEDIDVGQWLYIRKLTQDTFVDAYHITRQNFFANGIKIPEGIVRLYRKGKGRWMGSIHEYWQPDDQNRVEDVPPNCLEVRHYGYMEPQAKRKEKTEDYLARINKSLKDKPEDGFLWFQKAIAQIELNLPYDAGKSFSRAANYGYHIAQKSLALLNIKQAVDHLNRLLKVTPRQSPLYSFSQSLLDQLNQIIVPMERRNDEN